MRMNETIKNNFMSLVMLVFFSIGLVIAGNVYVTDGDLDVDNDLNVSNVLFVNGSSGNVGIGTTSPNEELQVNGDAIFGTGSINNPALWNRAINIVGTDVAIILTETTTNSDWSLAARTDGTFAIYDDGNSKLSITTNGALRMPSRSQVEWGGSNEMIFGDSVSNFVQIRTSGNNQVRVDSSGNVGIGTTSPTYPLEVVGNVSGISIWSDGNVSASGFITRTSVFDKSRGSALSFVSDADDYVIGGEIDHTKFYGYAGAFEVIDYDRSEVVDDEIVYPYTKKDQHNQRHKIIFNCLIHSHSLSTSKSPSVT